MATPDKKEEFLTSRPLVNSTKSLGEFVFLVLRRWYLLLLFGILSIGIAWVYLKSKPPIYEVRGSMFIKEQENSVESQTLQSLSLFQGQSNYFNLETEMQILGSRRLMRQVVDSLDLQNSYYVEETFRDVEHYEDAPVKLENIYNNATSFGKTLRIQMVDTLRFQLFREIPLDTINLYFNVPFSFEGGTYIIEPRQYLPGKVIKIAIGNPEIIAQALANTLEVNPLSMGTLPSDVLELVLETTSPIKGQDIIDNLVLIYNSNELNRKKLAERQALNFIDERLAYVTQELYTVEQQVEGYRRQRELPTEISTSAEVVMGQLERQDNELARIELQNRLLESIEAVFQDENNSYQPLPVVSGILEGALVELVPQYNNLIIRRGVLIKAATPDNPAIAEIDNQLEQLNKLIIINLSNTKEQLKQERIQIERRIEPIEQRIEAMPTYQRELLQIMRQQQIKEELFLFLLQRREETAIALSRKVGNSELLDNAMITNPMGAPIKPKKQFIYMSALLIGLLIPTGFLYAVYVLDDKVYSEKDVNELTNVPLISSINLSTKGENIVVTKGSRTAIAESFRLLRTNLQFMNSSKGVPIYLITSTVSGEGKTFISINLAASNSLAGKKTIILGLDLRKPKLSRYISDISHTVGITNYLVEEAEINDIIFKSDVVENLHYIPCGVIPPNPAELLMTERLGSLIEELKNRYDTIILDVPPVGLVADSMLLSKYATATIYVVRSGVTPRTDLDFLNKNYEKKTLPSLGVVLNGVKIGGGYYGRYYGYGRYSNYYVSDKKKGFFRRLLKW